MTAPSQAYVADATPVAPARPLRLAFIGDPNSIHTRRWLEAFVARGHEVHLVVPLGVVIEPGLDPRIAVRRFRAWPRLRLPGLPRLVTTLSIRRAVGAIRPDVLHAHYVTRYGWAGWLSGFHPRVVTAWGSDVLLAPAQPAPRRLAAATLSSADLVTAVSDDLARAAIALGAPAERVRIVQFGVDGERFAPGPAPADLRARLGVEGRRVIFSPRAMRPLYRHEVAIEALTQVPPDVVMLALEWAAEPEYRARLGARAAELGLAERVRFVPAIPHEELPGYYRLADVVVSLPSSDAFPVSLLEAMAAGTPVVAADGPSAREGLGGPDPSALVPGDDPVAVAAAIRARLDLDPEERAALGRRLRIAALERADSARHMARMESLYRDLAAGRTPA